MTRVRERMERDPVAAEVPSRRTDLIRLFATHQRPGFPVIKAGGRKLVGVVHRRHLFDYPEEEQTALLMDPNPATTYPEAHANEAARLLVDHRVRFLPVVAAANELVGAITGLALLESLAVPRTHLEAHLPHRFVPIHRATPARVALEILLRTRQAALPVLDDEGRYAGLLTEAHVLGSANVSDAEVTGTMGLAIDGDAWQWESVGRPRRTTHTIGRLEASDAVVGDLMDAEAPTTSPHATLRDAALVMVRTRRARLPVVDGDGRLLGVMSDLDLLSLALDPSGSGRRL